MKHLLLLTLFFLSISCCVINERAKERTKANHFKGVIVKIYEDPQNHMMLTYDVKTNYGIIQECADEWLQVREYGQMGDSIIKPKDTLVIIIKRDSIQKDFLYDNR